MKSTLHGSQFSCATQATAAKSHFTWRNHNWLKIAPLFLLFGFGMLPKSYGALTVTLTTPSSVSGASVCQYATDVPIYRFTLTSGGSGYSSSTFSGLSFTQSGSAAYPADITEYDLWLGSPGGTLVATSSTTTFSSFLVHTSYVSYFGGTTNDYYITANISGSAGVGNTIIVNPLTSTSFTMSGTATKSTSGTIATGGTQTIIAAAGISGVASLCEGSTITLTAATGGGTWATGTASVATVSGGTVGGVSAGTSAISYTLGGCTATQVETVNALVTPSVTITASPSGPVCSGTNVTFTPASDNGGTPGYEWFVNGVSVATTTTFSSSTLANNDVVSCVLTSSLACVIAPTDTSNLITMAVNAIVSPDVPSLSASGGSCHSLTLNWLPAANAGDYEVTIASDAGMGTILFGPALVGDVTTYTYGTGLSPSTTYYYQVRSFNTCGGGYSALTSVTAAATTAATPGLCECIPSGSLNCGTGQYIANVSISTTSLDNTTTCSTDGYAVFPASGSTTANLILGHNYTLSATSGTSASYGNGIEAFIDYNQDNTFSTGEYITISTNAHNLNHTYSTFVTIPSSATEGPTTMRVRYIGDGDGTSSGYSCTGPGTHGETEDYTVCLYNTTDITGQPASSTTLCQYAASPSLSVTATGSNLTYLWFNNGTSNSNIGGTSTGITASTFNTASTASAGTTYYYCEVTNVCGITTASNTAAVNVTEAPTVTAIATPGTICEGDTLGLNATPADGSGTYTAYSWTGPDGFTAATQIASNAGINTAGAGVYSVTVTDDNGCTSAPAVTASVTVGPLPTIMATAMPTAVCAGSTLSLNATPAGGSTVYSSFSWSGPDGFTASTQAASVAGMSASGTGVYSVSVTDNNGCTSATATTDAVTLNASPSIIASASPTALCAGDTLTLGSFASGGSGTYVSYSWAGPAGFTATGASPSPAGVGVGGSGVYSVTVTDDNGCTSPVGMTASITVNPLPTITATAMPAAICAGSTLTLNATPAGSTVYTAYSWSGPGSFTATTQNAADTAITDAGAGVYSVTVTDDNGCTSAPGVTAAVTVNPLPTVTATATPNPVCPNNTLSLSATPVGGSGTYPTYSWTGPGGYTASAQNSSNPGMSASGVGVYSVSVTDDNGCTSASVGTTDDVTLFDLPTITATAMPTAICAGNTLTLNATPAAGSSSSFTAYSWNGPGGFTASTQNAENTSIDAGGAGVYSVTVTDDNGCTSLTGETPTVTVNALPDVSNFNLPSAANPCQGSSSTVNVSSTSLGSGTFTVTYNLSGANTATAHTASLAMSGTAGAFAIPDTDLASAGATMITVTSVGNALGCSNSPSSGNTAGFNVNPLPLDITGTSSVCVGSTTALADLTTGGAGTWSSDNTSVASINSSGTVFGLSPGTATITYTIPSGCSTSMIEIVNPIPSIYSVTGGGTFCSSNPTVHVGLTGSDLGASYQIYISGVATGGLITGTGTTLDLGIQTISGTYTVVANPSATCRQSMSGSTTVTSHPSPNLFVVTGGGNACTGSGVTVGLSNAQSIVSYQLYNGTATVGSPVTGISYPFDFGSETTTGTYTVVATNTANSCTDTMTDSAIVTINSLPDAIDGATSVCSGLSTAFTDGTSGGTWSSSGAAVVDALSGTVTGGLPGTATITYALPTGCAVAKTLTINTSPSAIGGTAAVCSGGLTTSLSDGITGGIWSSSSTANASVNSINGLITSGISGIAPITYTLPGGCFTSVMVTVNTQPGPVTGATALCSGLSFTLNDDTTGGAWSSTNTTVATVDATLGSVIGYASGSAVISYTLPGGCAATLTVNVTPSGSISGPGNVCPGSAVSLSNTASGGTWSSGNLSAATVATLLSGEGAVTGVAAGTAIITYTLPTGCTSVYTITINPLPAIEDVTGGSAYCAGGTGVHIGLTGSESGINYQLFNGLAAIGSPLSGSGPALDFGSQTTAGTYIVSATNTTTGCSVQMSGSGTVSINALPTAFAMSGGGSYCTGGTGADVFLSGSAAGVSYQLYNASTAVGPALTGAGLSVDFGLQTASGSYGVVATNTTTGCTNVMSGVATVTILPLPTAYVVAGGGSYCAGGEGQHVFLSSSVIGTNYQLFNSGVPVGTTVLGTSAPLDFGAQTAAGVYTVTALNTATGCTGSMAGSVTVSVNPLPAIKTVTGGGGYCLGSASTLHVGLSGSVSGTTYQLLLGGAPAGTMPGTGSALDFGIESTAGTYTVIATDAATSCVATMSGSATIAVTALPTAFTVTGGGSYCTGAATVHVGLNGSTSGVNYQLYNSSAIVGSAVAGTGVSLDFGAQPAGAYTVRATNGTTGCTSNMTGTASIVLNPPPAAFTVSATSNSYCAGSAGPHILLGGSVIGTTYQLLFGATIVSSRSGTGASLDFGAVTSSGSPYSVTAVNTATGCTGGMTGSVSITINPLPVSTFSVTGGGTYCLGGSGKVVGLSNSTSGVSYQLLVGGLPTGSPVSGTGPAISFGAQTTVGSYTVVATNTTTTCTSNMAGSVSINTAALPVVYNVTGGGGYCNGTAAGVHIGLAASNVGVSYQLFRAGTIPVGAPVAGIGGTIDFGAQTTAGVYTIVGTNTTTLCTSNMFGSATVFISPLPSVYNVSTGGSYCLGGAGFPVALGNSDAGVNYQLLLGGIATGSPLAGTGLPLNFGDQAAAGNYTVFATDAVTGCNSNMSGAAAITIDPLPAVFNVTSAGTNYCAGGTGVDIALSGSATDFSYQLYNGGVPTGAAMSGTGAALDFGNQTTGVYTIVATNTLTTCTNTMSGLRVISTIPLPAQYTMTGGGNYCTGGTGVAVGLANSTGGLSYQLMVGGSPAGTAVLGTGLPLNFGLQTTTGAYTVTATNLITGCTQTMTGTATVNTVPLPAPHTVKGGGNYCVGGAGPDVFLDGSDGGVAYQLYNGLSPAGAPVAGTGAAIDFGPQTAAGAYSVVATNTGTSCNATMSGSVTVGISPLPNVYTVTGSGNYCPASAGVHIMLSNSDAGVNYQLYDGSATVGSPVAGIGSSLDFGPNTEGVYTVVAINTTTSCASNMSGNAMIAVSPLPVAYNVNGGGNYCSGGAGMHVTLDGSNTGNTYQLYLAGIPSGIPFAGTGFAIDFGAQTATGNYTVMATNSGTTCSNAMAGSAIVTISPLPGTFTISGGGAYCAGSGGVNIGLPSSEAGISYQLYNGIVATGASVPGTGFAIGFGMQTTAGAYTIVGTNTTTTCSSNMPGSAVVSINPLPSAYPITGGGNYCPSGAGVHIGLSGSSTGITYQLQNGAVPVGMPVTGTGSTIDFGLQTAPGNYTVFATNTATLCTADMPGSVTVTISSLPSVYTISGSASQYCAGGTGVSLSLSGSDAGTMYQLYNGPIPAGYPVAGTGLGLDLGSQTAAGAYTVIATNATGCVNNMSGSASISIASLPAVYPVAGGGNYCPGGAGVHVGLTGSQSGVIYQLYNGLTTEGSSIPGTGVGLDLGMHTDAGAYTVIATNPVTGCVNTMSGGATIGLNALPVVYTVTGGGNYCAGTVGLPVGLSSSASGVNYQLYNSAAPVSGPVAGTGGSFSFGTEAATGYYTVIATDAVTGCTNNMAGSASVIINTAPAPYTVIGGGNYCAGGAGLHVGMLNSAPGVNYQLYNGVAPAGASLAGTGVPLDFGLQSAAGSYNVIATDGTTGCTANMPGTATIAINPLPVAFTITGGGNYCTGGTGVHIGLNNSTPGISYQLLNASAPTGLPLSGTGVSIDFGLQTATGDYTIAANDPATGCIANMTGATTVAVNPLVAPSVTLSTTGADDTVCSGNPVTINASVINGGLTPTYSWRVNAIPVAASSGTFTYAPAVGDVVDLTVTSSAACATPSTAAASVLLNVLPHEMPVISITSGVGSTVCQGTTVTFRSDIAFGGGAPSFTWAVNGVTQSVADAYSYVPANGDVISATLSSNYRCRIASSVSSNVINMQVDAPVTPSVKVLANPGTHVPQGAIVELTAAVTNEVIAPSYQWSLNGVALPGATGSTYTVTNFAGLDSFSCLVTSGGGCAGLRGANGVTLHVSSEGVQQVTSTGSDIHLAPNPSKGTFTIKGTLGTTTDEEVSVEVSNMLGQVIYNDKIMARGGNIDQKIQLTGTIANGMYILNLRSASANDVFHVVIEQ